MSNKRKASGVPQPQSLLVYDTETTGLRANARVVQLAYSIVSLDDLTVITSHSDIVKPDGYIIVSEAAEIHKVSHRHAVLKGKPMGDLLKKLYRECARNNVQACLAHNEEFDCRVLLGEFRLYLPDKEQWFYRLPHYCSMMASMFECNLPPQPGRVEPKYPRLEELYKHIFGTAPDVVLHDAGNDVATLVKCLPWLREKGVLRVLIKK
jgi:DNA polymerase III epsilon subunit-like protein